MRIHSPYPASWALAQRIGYLYSEGEIIYLADTPFERLLDIQRQVGQCQTMTSLSQADFEARLEAVFHQNTGESQQIAQDIDQSVDLLSLSEEMPANEDLLNEDSAAPVIRLINAILSEAIKETASDIHIETYEKTMSIRFRIDGVLRTILQPNKKLAALLISRIKVMARLDIAEKRIPQDGRISLRIGRRNIDVRVSTLPSIGPLICAINSARYLRTLSILQSSGVPLLDGMNLSTESLNNLEIRQRLANAAENVRQGNSIHLSLEQTAIFPPMMLYMVASGEKSGQLGTLMVRAADNQETLQQNRIALTLSIFEPALIITMALIVLFIVVSVLQPLLQLNSMIN